MGADIKVKLSIEEANRLFVVTGPFELPAKLGDKLTYMDTERSIAALEVVQLYKTLRSMSPIHQLKERRYCFGPADAWKAVFLENEKNGKPEPTEEISGYQMIDPERKIEIRLSEDAASGLMWCLIYQLHPASKGALNNTYFAALAWSTAEKAGLAPALREFLGITTAPKRRWAFDAVLTDEGDEPVSSCDKVSMEK